MGMGATPRRVGLSYGIVVNFEPTSYECFSPSFFLRHRFVIGHLGETLPFMLPRLDFALPTQVTKRDRPIGAYLRENLHYTFSGFNYTPTFLDLLLQVGVDRIMFSADYPYASMVQAHAFLDQLPVSPADKERIAHGNAERLLRL